MLSTVAQEITVTVTHMYSAMLSDLLCLFLFVSSMFHVPFPLLEKPFPNDDEESHIRKWNALIKKLESIRFVETYAALKCTDGGVVGQCEHTVYITEGGPEILTVP